ncbi:hypothetical protein GCM10010305_59630 [Streptomyces termitum]|uniref:Uncharacterized protein n=1 Tax=Streptomyces termitum TaxID=67368 RepID=A0A918WD51_9ACTN|nr:hypothetical protein GCM10010305_59630 [Streptomyces termitum]
MPEALRTTGATASDADLLARTVIAVREAASALRERFGDVVPYRTREELMSALADNDDTALGTLRPALTRLRPDAGRVEDELDGGALPPGEWGVVDPAEGNVNHLHALPEWAVTATLVRENRPVLTAVHVPLTGETYTALAGGGATSTAARCASPRPRTSASASWPPARPGRTRTRRSCGASAPRSPRCSSTPSSSAPPSPRPCTC